MTRKKKVEEPGIDIGRLILLIAIVIGGYLVYIRNKDNKPEPTPVPVPITSDFPEPDQTLKAALPDMSKYISGRKALDLAYLYKNLASEVEFNDKITRLEQISAGHLHTGNSIERNNKEDVKLGVGKALDDFMLSNVITTIQDPLSTEEKKIISNGFRAIAWGFYIAAGEEGIRDLSQSMFTCDEDQCNFDKKAYLEFIQGISSSSNEEERKEIIDNDGHVRFMQFDGTDNNLIRGPPVDNALLNGLITDPVELEQFNSQIPKFQQFGYNGSGEGQTVLLYESLLKYDPEAFTERQVTGDCTSHGTRNGVDMARAYEIDKLGEVEAFVLRGATEAVYGYRGHGGQGMSVVRAMEYISEVGGLAIRKNYTDAGIDFSKYDPKEAIQWGRSGGTPKRLNDLISSNRVVTISLINSAEEARDAISNGFAIVSGSQHSFASKRDEYGFAARDGKKWGHCTAWGGLATLKDLTNGKNPSEEPCFLYINSWGDWNGGPKGKYNIPDGSFWITKDDAEFMIRQKQTYAVGQVQGFKAEKIQKFGFEWLD